jgi:chloramphenicol 3-O phosphotransferase
MHGRVVLLNGVPRAGKSTIAAAVQESLPGVWLNMDKDLFKAMTPPHLQPGIGLRPGGESPQLEDFIVAASAAMWESLVAHSRRGLDVVAATGIHDSYSKPLRLLAQCADLLAGLPVLFVGVRCSSLDVIKRRAATGWTPVPDEIIERFERSMHAHGRYDLEVDTSVLSTAECVEAIRKRLASGLDNSVLGQFRT